MPKFAHIENYPYLCNAKRIHTRGMVFPNVLKGWGFMSESEASACASDVKQTLAGSGLLGK